MIKNNKGITLISLVVTIIVLIILASVSVNIALGDNGLINTAEKSSENKRIQTVQETINVWRLKNELEEYSNTETQMEEELLNDLISTGMVKEGEIDKTNKIIKIGEHEISYGPEVVINISKTKLTKNGPVMLKVTSVKGIGKTRQLESLEEYGNLLLEKLNTMTDDEKKQILSKIAVPYFNLEMGTNFENYSELIEYFYNEGYIDANTEDAFYSSIKSIPLEDRASIPYIIYKTNYPLIGHFNEETNTLADYIITNPEGKERNLYVALSKGDYTFTVTDILTNKTYTKTVNVETDANIQIGSEYIITNQRTEYNGLTEKILLCDKEQNIPTTFEKAYMIYNDELIELIHCISYNEQNNYSILSGYGIRHLLKEKFLLNDYSMKKMAGTQTFFILKNDVWYIGDADFNWIN